MRFSEMPYERVNVKEVEKQLQDIMERAKKASSGEELFEIHREYYRLMGDVETNATLASIRHDVDTTDEFYEKEHDFYDENMPVLQNSVNEYMKILFQSCA